MVNEERHREKVEATIALARTIEEAELDAWATMRIACAIASLQCGMYRLALAEAENIRLRAESRSPSFLSDPEASDLSRDDLAEMLYRVHQGPVLEASIFNEPRSD